MSQGSEQAFLDIIAGRREGLAAASARGGLAVVEPLYAGLMAARNRLFDWRFKKSHRAARPVVSVGNITTGGTGKTPVVHWLVERLAEAGRRPAVLMRGYKAAAGAEGDEQAMLRQLFRDGPAAGVVVHANPDRVAGAAEIVRDHPDVDVIVLDDGFQHRRLARDFDLVLIDATSPFGFDHVIPRGLLREPLAGLRRADAIILTRSDQVATAKRDEIVARIERYARGRPIVQARHQLNGFASPSDESIPSLTGKRLIAFCGIGNPASFFRLLQANHAHVAESIWFPDHHAYTPEDLQRVASAAEARQADALVTTEKDWAKLQQLAGNSPVKFPIYRTILRIGFDPNDRQSLLSKIEASLK